MIDPRIWAERYSTTCEAEISEADGFWNGHVDGH